jgi:hypothetical protein
MQQPYLRTDTTPAGEIRLHHSIIQQDSICRAILSPNPISVKDMVLPLLMQQGSSCMMFLRPENSREARN